MVNRVNMIVIVLDLILTKKKENEKDQKKEMQSRYEEKWKFK